MAGACHRVSGFLIEQLEVLAEVIDHWGGGGSSTWWLVRCPSIPTVPEPCYRFQPSAPPPHPTTHHLAHAAQ